MYNDQTALPQEPRFGLSSFGGKAIREWSAKLYERIVEAKKIEEDEEGQKQGEAHGSLGNLMSSVKNQRYEERGGAGQGAATTTTSKEDPIRILKIRLAKGEITKEQYDELRKVFES